MLYSNDTIAKYGVEEVVLGCIICHIWRQKHDDFRGVLIVGRGRQLRLWNTTIREANNKKACIIKKGDELFSFQDMQIYYLPSMSAITFDIQAQSRPRQGKSQWPLVAVEMVLPRDYLSTIHMTCHHLLLLRQCSYGSPWYYGVQLRFREGDSDTVTVVKVKDTAGAIAIGHRRRSRSRQASEATKIRNFGGKNWVENLAGRQLPRGMKLSRVDHHVELHFENEESRFGSYIQ